MERCKRFKAEDEITLPEAVIQQIQSLLTRKEAARTTVLSKSWYNAWLCRPALNFDGRNYYGCGREWPDILKDFSTKTMQRYQDSSLKIESFRIRSRNYSGWADKLIVKAMNIGATDVDIELPGYTLRSEVLGSETLLRLSVCKSDIDAKYACCSRLKSLSLKLVRIERDVEFKHITSCCISLEELSLSHCYGLEISMMNLYELQKLRRLSLYSVVVHDTFFNDFKSRFPCLKYLSVFKCFGCRRIQIASTSLETISFHINESWTATFHVPNIRKFTYLGSALPRFVITGPSREWEFDISVTCNRFNKLSWFRSLKTLLTKFRLSRISLTINLEYGNSYTSEHEVNTEVVPEPLMVENLVINAPPSFCRALLIRLFGICRPKFITLFWPANEVNASLHFLHGRLMQQVITPNCGIPDQNLFGKFELKKVNVEAYEMVYKEWRPLVLDKPLDAFVTPVRKQKIRFELIWE